MLVVKRKVDEAFVIVLPDGREGRVVNLGFERIGIELPWDCKILREEVYERDKIEHSISREAAR